MKEKIVLDIECYPNYFLIAIKKLSDGKLLTIDMYSEHSTLTIEQRKKLHYILNSYTSFGYNSINYDMPLVYYALSGANCKTLYEASVKMIANGMKSWQSYREFGIEEGRYDHFDIQEPAPAVMISLKNYGTRIGSRKLWDLPYDPHTPLTKDEVENLKAYCENDLDVTIDLYTAIEERIKLREDMTDRYSLDLRSKSDAQIAEALLIKEIGYKGGRPELPRNYKIKYKAPDCIRFEHPTLQNTFELIKNAEFELNDNGSPKLPKELNKAINVYGKKYKVGIGGLHSQEKSIAVTSNSKKVLRNADVTSYYPSMILMFKWFPKHLGIEFLDVYSEFYWERNHPITGAKATGNKVVNEALKIVLNGSFGKLGSKWSKIYSPDLMLQVTLTGQLMLLMLIEQLEINGIEVISSNTDGIEYYCDRDKIDLAEAIIFDWELDTGMNMEHGEYISLYAKDVNNYVAVYDGYVKCKGIYAETTLSKGRSTPIVYEAIRQYLLNGTSLETTIERCDDINEFVSGRNVKGGAVYKGQYLGKVARWYYSKNGDSIHYKTNGNLVPKTAEGNGVKPMMDLPNSILGDIDYEWYHNEAVSKLKDLGVEYAE